MKARILNGCAALALAMAVTAVPVLQASAATSAGAKPLSSGSGPGQNLSATAASSWQTNDIVWAITSANGVVYVGGQFTSVRPPGDPKGTGEVARSFLAAFNSSTGGLLSFDPTLDGKVTALAVSPDGSTLYVGGSFTHVNGLFRNHLAAFSTATGAVTSWAPNATSSVLSIAPSPSGSAIYIGGNFGKLDNVVRTRAGAVTTSGSLLAWAPDLNGSVTSVAVAPDDSRVLVGGYFTSFNGVTQQSIGSTNPTTGASEPFAATIVPNKPGCVSDVKDIIVDGTAAYISAEGTGTGCFDGDFAATISDGTLLWQNDCLGATQSIAIINNWLYKGSHAHDCAYAPGGFPQVENADGDAVTHHLLNQSLTDGSLGHWNPNTNITSGGLGPRVLATDGTQLFVGGDFTTVNNKPQQGFARFEPTPDNAPARPAAPTVTSTSAGVDSVTFTGVSDLDDGTLTYSIFRSGVTAAVGTVTATSWPWALPVLHFRDAGLTPGSSHTYTVTASDGSLTSAKSPASAPVTVSATSPSQSYPQAVLAGSPSFFWRLDQTSGSTAADSSPHGFTGIYEPGTTQGVPGPITGDAATATEFDGHTGLVTSTAKVTGPATFSIELWFKSTTNTGGKLIGLGSSQTGMSSNYDRQIYLMNDGQLVFGAGSTKTIETPNVYNDGQWHYVVATMSPTARMLLYVDGQLVGTNSNGSAKSFSGFWRVGGDNLKGWSLDLSRPNSQTPTEPNSYFFAGTIGDVAVYPAVLSAAQVAAHYAANALSH
jgi:hypothetical protein